MKGKKNVLQSNIPACLEIARILTPVTGVLILMVIRRTLSDLRHYCHPSLYCPRSKTGNAAAFEKSFRKSTLGPACSHCDAIMRPETFLLAWDLLHETSRGKSLSREIKEFFETHWPTNFSEYLFSRKRYFQ